MDLKTMLEDGKSAENEKITCDFATSFPFGILFDGLRKIQELRREMNKNRSPLNFNNQIF